MGEENWRKTVQKYSFKEDTAYTENFKLWILYLIIRKILLNNILSNYVWYYLGLAILCYVTEYLLIYIGFHEQKYLFQACYWSIADIVETLHHMSLLQNLGTRSSFLLKQCWPFHTGKESMGYHELTLLNLDSNKCTLQNLSILLQHILTKLRMSSSKWRCYVLLREKSTRYLRAI